MRNRLVNRSRCAVNNYIKNKNKTPKKIPGRPEKQKWRTLKNCPNVEYSKEQKAPSWKEHHIKVRFSWAKKYVSFGGKNGVMLYLQIRKNGFHCYWHDLKKKAPKWRWLCNDIGSILF